MVKERKMEQPDVRPIIREGRRSRGETEITRRERKRGKGRAHEPRDLKSFRRDSWLTIPEARQH